MLNQIRRYENFHIFLWLLKDICWLQDYHTAGMIMLVPTVLAAFIITWLSRENRVDLLHNVAVSCWIIANGIWMTGEFFYNDTTRPYALVFFVIGIAIVGSYYLGVLPYRYLTQRK